MEETSRLFLFYLREIIKESIISFIIIDTLKYTYIQNALIFKGIDMLMAIVIVGSGALICGCIWGVFQMYNYYLKWKLEEAYKEMMEETPSKKHLFIVKK